MLYIHMSGVRFNPNREVRYTYASRDFKQPEHAGDMNKGYYDYYRKTGRNDTFDGINARRNYKIDHSNYARTGDEQYFKHKKLIKGNVVWDGPEEHSSTGQTIVNSINNSGPDRNWNDVNVNESLPPIGPLHIYPNQSEYGGNRRYYGGKRKSKKKQNKKSKKKQNKKSKKRLTYRRRRKSRK